MTLVDVPMLTSGTVRAVVEAWRHTRAPVARPIMEGRRGHPVIFDRQLFDELRSAPLDSGARVVVRAHWPESVDVPVQDPGCLIDVDTPADYRRLLD
jgi:molybdenum cofactor cytidylyltransferase